MQQNRQTIRQNILNLRQQITPAEQQVAAKKIAERVAQHPCFQTSQHIAAYHAFAGEVDPTPLLQLAWQQNKICYLPVLTPEQSLQFVRYDFGDALKPNCFNILEPEIKPEKIIAPEDLDLALVPLVAFDHQGNRLGMGKGYYDRTFEFLLTTKKAKPILVGLAYEFQKIAVIKLNKWDVPLQAVVTAEAFYPYSQSIL